MGEYGIWAGGKSGGYGKITFLLQLSMIVALCISDICGVIFCDSTKLGYWVMRLYWLSK